MTMRWARVASGLPLLARPVRCAPSVLPRAGFHHASVLMGGPGSGKRPPQGPDDDAPAEPEKAKQEKPAVKKPEKLKKAADASKIRSDASTDPKIAIPKPNRGVSEPEPTKAGKADSEPAHKAASGSSLLGTSKRNSRMFNPRGLDESGDEPPIHSTDRLLPIQLPFRPVFPGASTYLVSADAKLMSALRRLQACKNWDHRVFAVLSKTPVKTTQLVQNVDEVHDVGCVCLIDNITLHSVPESGVQTAYAVLFPMFRAHTGELVQSINVDVQKRANEEKQSVSDSKTDLSNEQTAAAAESSNADERDPRLNNPNPENVNESVNESLNESVNEKQATESSATPSASKSASKSASQTTDDAKKQSPSADEQSFPDTGSALAALGLHCMRGVRALPNNPYAVNDESVQRVCSTIIDALREIATSSGTAKRLVNEFSSLVSQAPGGPFPQPDFLADFTASILPKSDSLQTVLSEPDVLARLHTISELAAKEVAYLRVQEGIARFGHSQTEIRNREMILHEYLRYIKKELGLDGDDKSRAADKFAERASKLEMPPAVRQVFNDELSKFRSLEPTSGEYNTVRTYLDWLSVLPWGKTSVDRFDLEAAKKLLDSSHFGMKTVKERILEFLAVGKLTGSVDGKIICLSGPPGVGKTSIAKSVADSLNRKFDRFSVGGLNDASEIKGHRRTYVAAMPGRIIQALKRTQTLNPVILIDEIDKLGTSGAHGSPSAALLEVLDPEQNVNFQDTYLEVPVDLSKVLFLCTANYLDGIPPPLKDRMEIIDVGGYLPQEKVEIAFNHLAPKYKKETGLEPANVEIDRDALNELVHKYTREAGVRGLAKYIEKIYRKIAVKFVSSIDEKTAAKDAEKVEKKTVETSSKEKNLDEKNLDEKNLDETKLNKGTFSVDANPEKSSAKPESGADGAASKEPVQLIPKGLQESVEKFELKVGPKDVRSYLGAPLFNSSRLYDIFPPGVVMGLGWTPQGGMPLFVETVLQEPLSSTGKPRFARTGQLGDVMSESASIAYSFARMFLARKFPKNTFLNHAVLHTHFPEGAIKKDGPSAGVTMATSLLSIAMDVPVNSKVAMTGELSLTGKVLQIGGLREKAVAAKTAGASIIVFPDDNRAEWDEIDEDVKQGLTPVPVKMYDQVFDAAFGKVDPAEINSAWPELIPAPKPTTTVNSSTITAGQAM